MDLSIKELSRNEIPGADTYNKVALAIKYANVGPGLFLRKNASGGMQLELVHPNGTSTDESYDGSFSVSFENGSVNVKGGYVFFPFGIAQIQQRSLAFKNGKVVYIRCTSQTSGELRIGDFSRVYQLATSSSPDRFMVPIATVYKRGNDYYAKYHSYGDILVDCLPYFWAGGYDESKDQVLHHNTNGMLYWEDDESSSSSGSSSSSSSGSSSSGSSSSGSSSSGSSSSGSSSSSSSSSSSYSGEQRWGLYIKTDLVTHFDWISHTLVGIGSPNPPSGSMRVWGNLRQQESNISVSSSGDSLEVSGCATGDASFDSMVNGTYTKGKVGEYQYYRNGDALITGNAIPEP